ncbi:hypothetical protein FRX94_02360 [Corynebacterium canis]|uniref:Uncharacterized protein n=1 Tax=Corynebacterium canis TaxID=679663 RepID=A0A5C5UQJ0_9CORY|nr:hypothetical protein [Corynebacterium canis]TWT28751.1 hypothetical protein FRX94_02360 [Corynebacterium canis]WJY75670.1 hypothetical protein CCANI_09210 [Corynebacterium canis]
MRKFWYPVIGLILALGAIGGYLAYSSIEPEDEFVSHKPAFIGVSAEALKPLSNTDRNNVVLTSETGHELGLLQTQAVYFPSIERLGDYFAVPDEDHLLVLDKQLKLVRKLHIPGLGVGTLTNSHGSPNGNVAAFYFNDGNAEYRERHLMVLAEGDRVFSMHTRYKPDAVAACDDASIVWLEHFPESKDNTDGPGTTWMIHATIDGDVTEYEIPFAAEYSPTYHSSLNCLDEASYVVHYTDNDLLVLKIELVNGKSEIVDQGTMPLPEAMQAGRYYHTSGSKYYVYGESGALHRFDLDSRTEDYSVVPLDDKFRRRSITIEGDTALIVATFEGFDFKQALSLVDLNNPQCVSRPIRLRGYDTPPKTFGDHLFSASHIVVDSILPIEPNPKVDCA